MNRRFAEAKQAREKGFAEAKQAREKGFAEAERARDKGFAEAKDGRQDIKDEMNRRFDAVEGQLARLEAPYFQRGSEDKEVPVERVAEPRPSERYPVAGVRAGGAKKTRGREAGSRGKSSDGSAKAANR